MMKLLKLLSLSLLLVAFAACGGESDTDRVSFVDKAKQPRPEEQAPAATTASDDTVSTPTPASTPTSKALNETQEMDEGEFLSNSTSFAIFSGGWGGAGVAGFLQTSTKGSFLVSITRAGPFKITDVDAEGKDYFRVDVKFDNVTDDTALIEADGFMLADDGGIQYAYVVDATDLDLDVGGDLNPGATHRGYVLFDPVPADTAVVNISFNLGKDSSGALHGFAFELDLAGVTWPE